MDVKPLIKMLGTISPAGTALSITGAVDGFGSIAPSYPTDFYSLDWRKSQCRASLTKETLWYDRFVFGVRIARVSDGAYVLARFGYNYNSAYFFEIEFTSFASADSYPFGFAGNTDVEVSLTPLPDNYVASAGTYRNVDFSSGESPLSPVAVAENSCAVGPFAEATQWAERGVALGYRAMAGAPNSAALLGMAIAKGSVALGAQARAGVPMAVTMGRHGIAQRHQLAIGRAGVNGSNQRLMLDSLSPISSTLLNTASGTTGNALSSDNDYAMPSEAFNPGYVRLYGTVIATTGAPGSDALKVWTIDCMYRLDDTRYYSRLAPATVAVVYDSGSVGNSGLSIECDPGNLAIEMFTSGATRDFQAMLTLDEFPRWASLAYPTTMWGPGEGRMGMA